MGEQREKLIHFLDQFVSLMQLILQRNKDDIIFTQAFFAISWFAKSDRELFAVLNTCRR